MTRPIAGGIQATKTLLAALGLTLSCSHGAPPSKLGIVREQASLEAESDLGPKPPAPTAKASFETDGYWTPDDPLSDDYPVAIIDRQPLRRTLRADFEPPEKLLVVYEPDWASSITQIIEAARGQAEVLVLVDIRDMYRHPITKWRKQEHVQIVNLSLDSPWIRDFGPIQTYDVGQGLVWLDYGYASDRPKDDRAPNRLSQMLDAVMETPPFALDGGAIVSNGEGFCAITKMSAEEAGMDGFSPSELREFLNLLGCGTTALVPNLPDETTGHVDISVQFLESDLVVVGWADPDRYPAQSQALEETSRRMARAAELAERPLEIVRLPMESSGESFYSYVNSTRLANRLLVPQYFEVRPFIQNAAYATLETALPDVELAPIAADMMVQRGGAVHCITLGLGPTHRPAPRLARPRGRQVPRG